MSSGLQSMSSWLVQVFLLLFPCYVNCEFERRVCRMEELRVCISVLTVRQRRRAWEGTESLPGVILIKENSNCSGSFCLQLFLSEPLSPLKYENDFFFFWYGLSVTSSVQEELVLLNVISTLWVLSLILPHFTYFKLSQLRLLELGWF